MKKINLYFLIIIGIGLSCSYADSYAESSNDQPKNIGNFALPFSQQPGAFLSFGQNTLGKGQAQLYFFSDDFIGNQQHYIDAMPAVVYGVTDNLSMVLTIPFAVDYQQESNHSSGLSDIFLQFEYSYFSRETSSYSETATLVFNTSFPTGSEIKNPPTGDGSQSFFLGGTFSRLYTDWIVFASPGVMATTSYHGTKYGNNYLYQFGLGRNIAYEESKYITSCLLEFNGTYSQKDRINGEVEQSSGGNIIYATPSLWYSTQHLILQAGMGWALSQHWNGDQSKNKYLIAANIGWTF